MSMKQFDIGLCSGYCTANFGGCLTQYAMYQCLKNLGYSVYMIERHNLCFDKKMYNLRLLWPKLPYEKHELAPYCDSIEDCVQYNKYCKMFLIGSDQFMNTYLYHRTRQFFSLKWVYDCKPKMAYSTSFGFDYLWDTEEQILERKFYLQRFDKFSVREKSGVNLMQKYFQLESEWMLDPVFLCHLQYYDNIADESSEIDQYQDKYIFAYILDPSPEKENILHRLENDLHLPVCIFSDLENHVEQYDSNWNLQSKTDADIPTFLHALRSSDLVVTDSFHGTCFSLLYHKNFVTILNQKRGLARFESIADLFPVKHKMINHIDELAPALQEIDYTDFDRILLSERKRCLTWLNENIKILLSQKREMTSYDIYLKNQSDKQLHNKTFMDINELYLLKGCTVQNIIEQLPENSYFQQVQGQLGEPIADTPEPFGVLTIKKTTNYFVEVTFSQMTIANQQPKFWIGHYVNKKLTGWVQLHSL